MVKQRRQEKSRASSVASAFIKAARGLAKALPIILGVVLLVGLVTSLVTKEMMSSVFTGHALSDTLVGSAIGSLAAGNPITSYIIGGELLDEGVSLYAVIAFVVAWVTVGLVQFPAEAALLGRRFAALRNATAFLFAILVSVLTVLTLGLLT